MQAACQFGYEVKTSVSDDLISAKIRDFHAHYDRNAHRFTRL
jgi:hypothetical protein